MCKLPGFRCAVPAITVLLLGLLAPAAIQADDCDAEADARLEHENKDGDWVHLQFKVSVSTRADCGKILWDLVVEEQLPNGQTKKVRHPNVITLHDSSVQSLIKHKMYSSHSMVSYEAKVISCEPCEDV